MSPKLTICRIVLAVALAGAGLAQAEETATPAPADSYRIQPSDTLQVTVFREPDLSVPVKVTQSGTINYPLLGAVPVGGLTITEAEKKLTELLADGYLVKPRISIVVGRTGSRRVIVLGQVKSPGTFEMEPDESFTVLQAIARAGGFTDIAATDRVSIIRSAEGKEQKIPVNVAAIMRGRDRNKDIELQPGDVVSVPETIF